MADIESEIDKDDLFGHFDAGPAGVKKDEDTLLKKLSSFSILLIRDEASVPLLGCEITSL